MSNKKHNEKPIKKEEKIEKKPKNTTQSKNVEKEKISEKNLAIIITAVVLLAITVCASAFFLVDAIINNKFFSYLTSDLSKYVTISDKDYKNLTINVDIAEPHEIDVDVAILALLANDKGEAIEDGASFKTENENSQFTVTPGTMLRIWYRGYLLDENGDQIEVARMSNFAATEPSALEIGSGNFIPGFELGLNGIYTGDYPRFVKITDKETEITESHIAYVSFSRLIEGGDAKKDTLKTTSTRINLSADDIEKNFGVGFKEKILGATIGEKLEKFTAEIDGKKYDYTDVTVDFVTDCETSKENPPLKVEAYFPYDYNTATLRNETAYFEVYIESGILYEEQKFTNEYVEKLVKKEGSKITLEELNKFDGAALTDKYRAYVKKTIDDIYEEEYENAINDAYKTTWDRILAGAKVLKYPKNEVDKIYEEYVEDVEYQFAESGGYYTNESTGESQTYNDVDSYARAYLQLSATTNWKTYLRNMSESLVKERLVLYYIIREEGLKLTNKELKAEIEKTKQIYLDEYVEQYLAYEQKSRDDFKSDEEYEEYVEDRAAEIFGYYDDDYFKETTYYNILKENVQKWSKIETLDERRAYPVTK